MSTERGTEFSRLLPVIRLARFSSQFVREALDKHLPRGGVVLDPFAGVRTTLVETIRSGPTFKAVGFEINPYAAFAAVVFVTMGGQDVAPEMS